MEVISLNTDPHATTDTSFTDQGKSQKTPQKHPVPPPRKKISSGNDTGVYDKTVTPEPDTSLRLALPQVLLHEKMIVQVSEKSLVPVSGCDSIYENVS